MNQCEAIDHLYQVLFVVAKKLYAVPPPALDKFGGHIVHGHVPAIAVKLA